MKMSVNTLVQLVKQPVEYETPELIKRGLEKGLFLKYDAQQIQVEVSTPSGVYWASARFLPTQEGDPPRFHWSVDLNGEMIETAPRGVMIDIGAGIGRYTLPMAIRASRVYAFEPQKDNFKNLQETVARFDNVTLVPLPVGGRGKMAYQKIKFYQTIREDHGGAYALEHTTHAPIAKEKDGYLKYDEGTEMTMVCIDDFFRDTQNITAIKIDVEGAEQKVLEGGIKVLGKQRPMISLETHRHINTEAIFDLLKQLDYAIISNDGTRVNSIEENSQYLCKPK